MFKRGRSRTRVRWVTVGVLVLFVAGCAWAFLSYYDYNLVASGYDEAASDYRRAGLPWTGRELVPHGDTQPSENAATPILLALKSVPDKRYEYSSVEQKAVRQWQNTGAYHKLLQCTDSLQPSFTKIREATSRPKLDYHRNWDAGKELEFPELSKTKWFVRQLVIRAEAHAGLGNAPEAISDISTAWKLARLNGTEPVAMSYLQGASCEAIVLDSIQRCAAILPKDKEFLKSVDDLLVGYEDQDLARACRGELFIGLAYLRSMKTEDWTNPDYPDLCTPFWYDTDWFEPVDTAIDRTLFRTAKGRAMMARYMEVAAEIGQVINKTKHDPRLMSTAMLDRLEVHLKRKGKSNGLMNIFMVFGSGGDASLGRYARVETTRTLLKALNFRAENGRSPNSLSDIKPERTDRFDGSPLRMKRLGNEIRIYSVGPDLKDNGGLTSAEAIALGKRSDDIVAIYPPLKLRP